MVDLVSPWLVAVWPGMGGVAQIAAAHLVNQLGALPAGVLDPADFFDLRSVRVHNGLFVPAELPKSTFYAWKDPDSKRDLLVFVGDQQPGQQGFRFCERLLDRAKELGVQRVFAFAAMAAPIDPRSNPKVYGVATEAGLLNEAREQGAVILKDGEITGLNGILPGVAASRGMDGLCLLGEIPFYASGTPNPKAAAAVLRVFTGLAGLKVDFTELDRQGRAIEIQLVQLLERLQQASGSQANLGEPEEKPEFEAAYEGDDEEAGGEAAEGDGESEPEVELSADVRARIERLFAEAEHDRAKALDLKAELDRHGAFKQYEDRFLDLFKKAG